MMNAIVAHLFADFILQNDWMALNKKKRSWPCFVHCAIWTTVVCTFAGWCNPLAVAWLFGTHFILDRTHLVKQFMICHGQESFATGALSPWSIVVCDQVWHIMTLWVVWQFYGINGV